MTIVSEDSVFRRLPHGLSQRHVVFFDGLRISAEIASQAYNDLFTAISGLEPNRNSGVSRNYVFLIRHSWTFIDALHRFRSILLNAPGIKHNHVFKLFVRKTEIVTEMRNTAQHLDKELAGIAERSQGAYGTLSWVVGMGDSEVPRSAMLNLGTAYGRVVGPLIDFCERLPIGEIRRLKLELAKQELLLSETYQDLEQLFKSLENGLNCVAEGKDRYGSDQFIMLNLVPRPDEAQDAAGT